MSWQSERLVPAMTLDSGGTEALKTDKSLEIERKFLVDELPDLGDRVKCEDILQGYLAVAEDGTEVRLRRKGSRCFQTIKGSGDMVRTEYEIALTPEQFAALWPATEGMRVEKTRYEIGYQGQTIELDVYHGELEGLRTAEIEFKSVTESTAFEVPNWFGMEVTCDHRYKNKYLALGSFREITHSACI